MITVMTVCAGLEPDAVFRLARGVERHMPAGTEYRIWCLTDIVPSPYEAQGVHWEPLITGWPRHYAKVEMWRPDLEVLGRILYMDLSCVVQDDLTPLIEYDGPFCVLKDFYWGTPCQSVCSFAPGEGRPYFDAFAEHKGEFMALGDQRVPPNFFDQVLMNLVDRRGPVDYWPETAVASYKVQGASPKATVVKFHGKPKPETTDWAFNQWMVNAGLPTPAAPAELPDWRLENVRYALSQGFPQVELGEMKERSVAVVGSDASRTIEQVQSSKADCIAAVDEAGEWLTRHEVKPDILVLVDPPKVIPPAHTYYVASHCPKRVFDQLRRKSFEIFHACSGRPEMVVLLNNHYCRETPHKEHFWMMMSRGGPSSSGYLHALSVLINQGCRDFDFIGFDSCGETGEEVRVMGETFYCTPQQYDQARGFLELCNIYGIRAQFHGNGLINALMRTRTLTGRRKEEK